MLEVFVELVSKFYTHSCVMCFRRV